MRDRRRRRQRAWLGTTLTAACLLVGLSLAAFYAFWPREPSGEDTPVVATDDPASRKRSNPPSKPPSNPPSKPSQPSPAERGRAIEKLGSRLPAISEAHEGTHGVVVFDPLSGKSASFNADRRFIAASLSKMYTLLALYRAADRGEVGLDDEITMRPSDVWAQGTGVLYRSPPGRTMTLRECATFLIRESDNTAEVMLHRYLGEETIESELRALGAHSTSYWEPNTTTPSDILLVLKAIADPSYTSSELSEEMLDIMTGTSFEGRMPEPLPEGTRVAHKIGSYESTFSDAGIVFPHEDRGTDDQEYYVVVFADGVTGAEAREAIQEFSSEAYEALASANGS